MCGIKLARAVTGCPKIAKTEGAYHGTYDYAEVSQKARPENWGDHDQPNQVPVAKGTPRRALDDVVVFPFNDIERTLSLLDSNKNELACVILDLLPHRVGLVPASAEFIEALRNWTNENGKLLIFDEVITFRMGYGGAADWFDAIGGPDSYGQNYWRWIPRRCASRKIRVHGFPWTPRGLNYLFHIQEHFPRTRSR